MLTSTSLWVQSTASRDSPQSRYLVPIRTHQLTTEVKVICAGFVTDDHCILSLSLSLSLSITSLGARSADGIVNEAMSVARTVAMDRLSGKKTGGSGGSSGGGSGRSGGGSSDGKDVVELTDSNFEQLVVNSDDMWLVEFFAPWLVMYQKLYCFVS